MCWTHGNIGAQRQHNALRFNEMVNTESQRCGSPSVGRQADGGPGPMPRKGPPQTTMLGGKNKTRTAASKKRRRKMKRPTPEQINDSKPLRVLQWNAEGLFPKKTPLAERLKTEQIDIVCIQETHLSKDRRFTIRG